MPRKRVRIFPLYEELRRVTEALTNEQFGKAVRHALSRYYDGEEQEETDGVISLAAAMMLDQAARYDSFREQQRENGLKPKNEGQPREAKVSQTQQITPMWSRGYLPFPFPFPFPIILVPKLCSF